jgi:hypothetical protein
VSEYKTKRPWWWCLNPWRYSLRRDAAYEDALDIIQELSGTCLEVGPARKGRPGTVYVERPE